MPERPVPPQDTGGDEEPTGPQDGRSRLMAALRRPGSRAQVVAGVLLAVVGYAAVTQVRSNGRDDAYVGARQGDLIQYINSLALASQRAESEIASLQQTRESLSSDSNAQRTAIERAKQQATTLGILAGTVPAEGPGIRVTVTDSGHGSGVGSNQLVDGLEELRDAGAEVIELNDTVRVVAQTSVVDSPSGTGVVVGDRRLKAPYTIDAIGDAHTLATALDFAQGFTDEVRAVGGDVKVKELQEVDVGSVVDLQDPAYAKSVAG